jgi:AbrB family looped-hinge helix DNA binding protein
VTIPFEIRRRFQLRPGDQIDFRTDGSSVHLVPLTKRRPNELYGALPATAPYADKAAERNEIGRMLVAHLNSKLPRR